MRGISNTIREAKDGIKESFKEAMVGLPVENAIEIFHEAELEMEEMLNSEIENNPPIAAKSVFKKLV